MCIFFVPHHLVSITTQYMVNRVHTPLGSRAVNFYVVC